MLSLPRGLGSVFGWGTKIPQASAAWPKKKLMLQLKLLLQVSFLLDWQSADLPVQIQQLFYYSEVWGSHGKFS